LARWEVVEDGPPGIWATYSSSPDSATLLNNGERIDPCGVNAREKRLFGGFS
jgi:hypothetical protein